MSAKRHDHRVVVIGWDGATFDLLLPWVEQGKLPNFAAFLHGSAHGPPRFIRDHLEPGDAVMVALPNQAHVFLDRPIDFWLQTQMALQLTLDDLHTVPRHRLSVEKTIPNLDQLHEVLARYRRVWYITSPGAPITSTTSEESAALIRQEMAVVYQNFRTLVFLFGDSHLPEYLQQKSETTLNEAPTVLIP